MSLKILTVAGCSKLKKLPDELGCLQSLEEPIAKTILCTFDKTSGITIGGMFATAFFVQCGVLLMVITNKMCGPKFFVKFILPENIDVK